MSIDRLEYVLENEHRQKMVFILFLFLVYNNNLEKLIRNNLISALYLMLPGVFNTTVNMKAYIILIVTMPNYFTENTNKYPDSES